MRKFLIVSKLFTGTAEIYFNQQGILCVINLKNTEMNPEQVAYFKETVPATFNELKESTDFLNENTIVESGYRIGFDAFWKAYNKKINKLRCIPLYDKLSDADTVQCYEGVKIYDRYLERKKVREKLDPENYLKNMSWQNEWK